MNEEKNKKRIERVKLIMTTLDLTQIKMSQDIDIQQSHISRYLTGALEVSDGFCYRLICNYGINPQWLENGKGKMFLDDFGVENDAGGNEIVLDMDAYTHMSEDLKTFRGMVNNLNAIVERQNRRIDELENELKNKQVADNAYAVFDKIGND